MRQWVITWTKTFRVHQGAPLRYRRRVRLAVAQMALAPGDSLTEAAAGFSSDTGCAARGSIFPVPGTVTRPPENG